MKSAEAILAAELKKLGFQRKGRRILYTRKNDIIGLIAFERPTSILYLQFAIVPLFLPCPGFIGFSFGNRLESMGFGLPTITKESTEEEIDEFCWEAMWHIQGDLIPFMEQMSTATALCEFSKNGIRPFRRRYTKYIFCNPEQLRQLYLYSSLYSHDYQGALDAAEKHISYVKKIKYYSKELKARKIGESEMLVSTIKNEEYARIDEMLKQNIEENLSLFSGGKR